MVESSSDQTDAVTYFQISLTESDVYRNVRHFLLSVLPDGMQVVQGQQNRNAAPTDPFCAMVIVGRSRLATNGSVYNGTDTRTVTEMVQITMQINLFGPASSNQMQMVTALWRDTYAVDFFRASGVPISPLYTSSVRQLGFVTGEKQYDDCWIVDLIMQANLETNIPQQFADTLSAGVISVEVEFPPSE